jgi:hypothetical protein
VDDSVPTAVVVPVFHSGPALLIWLAVTVAMPVVVGLLTKPQTPAAVKSLGLVAASLLNGLLSEALAAGDGYDWRKAILQVAVSFVIAGASYARVWRPLGVADAAQRVGTKRDQDLAA